MPLMISGMHSTDLRELVHAILAGDLLSARQWVADAQRAKVEWTQVPAPNGLSEREMTVAAGVAELLAARAGAGPPTWTAAIGAQKEPLVLDPGLEKMPRSYAQAKSSAPEPLRKRNLIALPDFLNVA
jgi:hypothetical protein